MSEIKCYGSLEEEDVMSVMAKEMARRKWYQRRHMDRKAFQVWRGHGKEVIELEQSLFEVEWREAV